ncbi:matrixin family metalloprotease [Aliifodinibius salicampi]|uniref:Matrixin family metalloprotease n=1 Tax=Fodinibius salicampi TaxID=1920655 RepID=A0ABT3PVV9_9BACT|nr:matrixin family metalloprotease [Fodinibius salicampi]MCW9711982.1 matrixin family metalloprotease [Fodinibius salicampi]
MNKQFIAIIFPLFIIVGLLGYLKSSESTSPKDPCKLPRTYQLGDIDKRFDINRQKLSNVLTSVEDIWENSLNHEILRYDPDGEIKIHLVYSDQQELIDAEQRASKQIATKRAQSNEAEKKYKRIRDEFDQKHNELQKIINRHKELIEVYNKKGKQFTEDSKLTEEEKKELKKRQQQIEQVESERDSLLEAVQELQRRVNNQSDRVNQIIDQENRLIEQYNQQFSGKRKFDQGHYIRNKDGERINIYQFSSKNELKVVLAHEFGHALGLNHGDNPESIMYHLMNKQNWEDPTLTEEELMEFRSRCL